MSDTKGGGCGFKQDGLLGGYPSNSDMQEVLTLCSTALDLAPSLSAM